MAIEQNSEILAKDIRKELRRNYLGSTLSTITANGVTCTNNSDGTYTVNGKATDDVWLALGYSYLPKGTYRLVGNKANSGVHLKLHDNLWSSQCTDLGSGANIEINGDTYELSIYVSSGTSIVSNTLIKPMVTNDLEATYDDFTPYNRSLAVNSNVAQKSDVLSLEEIQASTDLTGKIASASALDKRTIIETEYQVAFSSNSNASPFVCQGIIYSDIKFEDFIGCYSRDTPHSFSLQNDNGKALIVVYGNTHINGQTRSVFIRHFKP